MYNFSNHQNVILTPSHYNPRDKSKDLDHEFLVYRKFGSTEVWVVTYVLFFIIAHAKVEPRPTEYSGLYLQESLGQVEVMQCPIKLKYLPIGLFC